jgi:hypothetical protein
MAFFSQELLSDMMKVASFISLSVLPRNAREKVKRVFAATWTRRIALPPPTSRVMQLSALVRILSKPHSKRHSPEGVMDQYLQRSLAKVNNLLRYLTALILLKNPGECLILILNAVTYETLSGLTLRDGVPKTTARIESSRTVSLKFL